MMQFVSDLGSPARPACAPLPSSWRNILGRLWQEITEHQQARADRRIRFFLGLHDDASLHALGLDDREIAAIRRTSPR